MFPTDIYFSVSSVAFFDNYHTSIINLLKIYIISNKKKFTIFNY